WARRPELVEAIRRDRRNVDYLPDVALPDGLTATADLEEAVAGCALVVFATPAQTVRSVAAQLADTLGPEHVLISVAKGIELGTLLTTTQVLRDALPHADPARIGVLYGPSHAEE